MKLLRSRVGLAVELGNLRCADMRVALRGTDPCVPEQFLDGSEISALLEQMRRERMTERVGADARRGTGLGDVTPHETINAAAR